MEKKGKIIGDYQFIKELGSGQFGCVWECFHLPSSKIVAIKCVPKEKLQSNTLIKKLFISEVALMEKIKNDYVVKFHGYFEAPSTCYIVMEFCNEGDMEQYLKKKGGSLSEDEAIKYLKQILIGFKSLHELGIMHRDFKISNVFLNDSNVKIGDLGFAKEAVVTETVVGTPLNMAPEILKNLPYDNKVDLWSLGVVYYQFLFGEFPFYAKSIPSLLNIYKNPISNNIFQKKNIKISEKSKNFLMKIFVVDPKKKN